MRMRIVRLQLLGNIQTNSLASELGIADQKLEDFFPSSTTGFFNSDETIDRTRD